ncbi:MAG: hypothetical protein CBC13_00750 [Planctomycetia bacterium TMED53]|nr:MAG: hypothetical protein CBC13_00750 [Planctomycetia bacterium TMED53]
MIQAFLFFALCACLSTVHVLVTLKQRPGRSVPKEVLKHFTHLTLLILLISGVIQWLSLAFQ